MEPLEFRFERFAMDTRPHHRALLAEGKRVPLDSQAFNLLDFLVRHRDRAWTVDDLLQKAFRARVEPGNVAVQISAIRKVFRDSGCKDDLICTLKQPTRYQFVGDVQPTPDPPVSDVSVAAFEAAPGGGWALRPVTPPHGLGRGPRVVAACVTALCVAGALIWRYAADPARRPPAAVSARPLTIAVMPFRSGSNDPDLDSLADEVTDDLDTDLFRVPGSMVIARGSTAQHEGETEQQVGRALDVRYVLEGTINMMAGAIKVHAVLIDATDGKLLGAWGLERPKDQVAELSQDVLAKIVSPLHIRLDDVASASTDKVPDAWEFFIRARHILDWSDKLDDFSQAQDLLENAIALDPTFADAQAELGQMLLRKVELHDYAASTKDLHRAFEVIRQAMAPPNPPVLARVAHAHQLQIENKCSEAMPILEQIVAAETSNLDARLVLARCKQFVPDLADVIAQYRAILRLDPDSPLSQRRHFSLGTSLLMQGQVPEAIEQLNQCVEEAQPSPQLTPGEQCRLVLIAAHDLNGERARARSDYAKYKNIWPLRSVWRFSAYFPPIWNSDLPGFQHFKEALIDAGMSAFADEHESSLPGGAACAEGDFAPTPTSLGSRGEIIDTPMFKNILAGKQSVVIDLGRGTVTYPTWLTYSSLAHIDEDETAFARRMAKEHLGSAAQRPLVVLSDGVTGCTSYQAAIALLHDGYQRVAWYRGGEEAFAHSRSDKP